MSEQQYLSDVIDRYLAWCKAGLQARGTLNGKQRVLRELLAHTGNIQIKNLSAGHIDSFLGAAQARGLQPGSMNNHLDYVGGLVTFVRDRPEYRYRHNPMAGRRRYRVPDKKRLQIPPSKFGALLDAADHPRDRMVVALGIYLFLRQSEMRLLRWKDVDLASGLIHVTIVKTGQVDSMPICSELDGELRRWMRFYQDHTGQALSMDWLVVPAKTSPVHQGAGYGKFITTDAQVLLKPTKPINHVEEVVTRVLPRIGYSLVDENGESNREGIHTLRRSGARALFDNMIDQGYDGALRTVQAMLHHSTSRMTEHYLGLDLDRKKRDDLLRGKPMYAPAGRSNVVELVREA